MSLQLVPARTGARWVTLGMRTFLRQPLALAGLFFLFVSAMTLVSKLPLVGVALAMSNAMPISCVPDFPLLHPTLMPREQAFVVKVAIMCALEAPITWRESMRMPRQLDTVFGVDDRAREMLADATGDAMQFYYPEMEDTQSARRAGEVTY